MEDEQEAIVNKCLQQLQKAFKSVLQESEIWQKSHQESSKSLDSIVNLAETLQCCSKVKISDTPLRAFPDVKEKLMYKIDQTIEDEMQQLRKSFDVLSKTQEKVSHQCTTTMQLYNRNSSQLKVEELSKATATRPSIATMLEWMKDLDQLYYELLITQECLLNNVNYTSSEKMEHFQKQWPKCDSLRNKLDEINLYTTFFMEEKL